jgi:phosphate transport system ATP-binding protein
MTDTRSASAPKIEVATLRVRFGATVALKGVSLRIAPRSAMALIGASGAGKTVLLRAINRLHDLDETAVVEGSVKLDDVEMLGAGIDVSALRRRAGMIFPRPTVLPGTIADNATFALRAGGVRSQRDLEDGCQRALTRALLWEQVRNVLDEPARSLPVDLQQRLCIARALAVDPEVLLCDSPTSGLDPIAAAGIEDVIARLRRDCTIVLATNDLQQAARLSDAACFMAAGEVVESADTPALFSRPANARTEDFLAGRAS